MPTKTFTAKQLATILQVSTHTVYFRVKILRSLVRSRLCPLVRGRELKSLAARLALAHRPTQEMTRPIPQKVRLNSRKPAINGSTSLLNLSYKSRNPCPGNSAEMPQVRMTLLLRNGRYSKPMLGSTPMK
jgi:hypothetical protein